MTFNTGNNVPSTDPRDLNDNAENLDLLSVGSEMHYPDRLGRLRKSWAGLEQQLGDFLVSQGWEAVYLQYAADVVVQRPTQLIERDGELYRVRLQSDLPLNLTGTFATDAPKFVAVGNQALRELLSGANGARIVGYGSGTVEQALGQLAEPAASDNPGRIKTTSPSAAQSSVAVDSAQTPLGSRAIERASLSLRNTYNSWMSGGSISGARTVNVLGDSISFGAGAGTVQGDIGRNGWVRILQKMLNIENGGSNYGFVSAYASNGTGVEIHTVTQVPAVAGQFWGALQDAAGGHLPNGWAITSSQVGDALRFGIPSKFRQFRVWFDGTQTGSFTVAINGGAPLATITASGSGSGLDKSQVFTLLDWGAGSARIDIAVVSGTVAISGIEYSNDTSGFALNNFSRDGRKIQYVSESVISAMCNGAGALVWALGANDQMATGPDRAAVVQRMDWIIQYANQHQCRLVIVDFLLQQPGSHWLREEYRRVARSVPGSLLVPLPNLLDPGGAPLTAAQLNGRNITSDGTHLTQQGNRMVAEAVSSCLGISVRSKGLAERLDSSWTPLTLINGVTNLVTDTRSISAYRLNNATLEVHLNIGLPVLGTHIATIGLGYSTLRAGGNFRSAPDVSGKACLVAINASGQIRIYADPGAGGSPEQVAAYIAIPLVEDLKFQPYY